MRSFFISCCFILSWWGEEGEGELVTDAETEEAEQGDGVGAQAPAQIAWAGISWRVGHCVGWGVGKGIIRMVGREGEGW